MPGYGPSGTTTSSKGGDLHALAKKLTPAEEAVVNERREQNERDGRERVRTHEIGKAAAHRADYLQRCNTYVSDATSSYARAHRLVRAAGDILTDERAHIVPSRQWPVVKAACGVKPGLSTGSIGWGRTLSEATCPNCLVICSEPRTGWWGTGTGDKFRCS